jgi:integrase
LYLQVTPSGGRWWRFKYRIYGKSKLLSFGTYPEVSLSEARDKREEARKLIAKGIDPGEARKSQKAAGTANAENSFEVIAREWHAKFAPSWAESHAKTILGRLEKEVFPWMGRRPIKEIEAPELLAVLRRIESRGALELAHRIKIICGQVFTYAIATGRAQRNPAPDLKGALPPTVTHHHAAIIDPKELAALLRALDGYQGSFIVRCALQMQALTFVRPGKLRHAEWAEIDVEAGIWEIPGEKMKMKAPRIVPLSQQAVAVLEELKPLTGRGRYVFPSHRSPLRAMSENAVLGALRRMGFSKDEVTGHGFRATARTILDEVLHERPDIIEAQLAHAVRDANGRAYNRTSFIDERRRMMQTWADYLDGLRQGAQVIPLRQKRA